MSEGKKIRKLRELLGLEQSASWLRGADWCGFEMWNMMMMVIGYDDGDWGN